MKYHVTVDGHEHEVVLEERLGTLSVRFDGEPVLVRYEEVDRLGQVALFLGERSYAVSIEGDANRATVTVAGALHRVEIEDERERAAHAAERERGAGGAEVRSVMPGIVVEVLVAEGQAVAKGQPLLILEAMKMQNEIAAPQAGRVAAISVQKGTTVGNGALLVRLAPEEAPEGGSAPDPAQG